MTSVNNNNPYMEQIYNITNDIKFKKFFKNNFTSPLSVLILNEIYPYVYVSIILVIISFLLILSIFVLLIRQFNYLNMLIDNSKIDMISIKK